MLRLTILGIVSSLIWCGCNSLGRRSPDDSTLAADASDTVFIGKGYDSETFQSLDICVEGGVRIERQTLVSWNFLAIEGWDIEKKDLGFKGDGEYAYQLLQGQPKAEFVRQIRDSELSSSYILRADYIRSVKFSNWATVMPKYLTEAQSSEQKAREFRRRCGDQYLSQLDYGGRLRILVKFRFNNRESKKAHKFDLATAQQAQSVALDLSSLSESDKKSSWVEISHFQEGGDRKHIAEELLSGSTLNCSLDQWDRCKTLIANYINYSLSVFPADISDEQSRVIAFASRPYEDISFPETSPEIKEARRATAWEFERQDYDLIKIDSILAAPGQDAISDRRRALDLMGASIRRNLVKLKANLRICIEFPTGLQPCQNLSALALESYDPDKIVAGSTHIVGPSLGAQQGTAYDSLCNNLMTGLKGFYGSVLDQVTLACDDGIMMPKIGRMDARQNFDVNCPAGEVVTGIRGGFGSSHYIGSLTLACRSLEAMRRGETAASPHMLRIFGNRSDFVWDCPPGFAATGIRGLSGPYVNALTLVCANF